MKRPLTNRLAPAARALIAAVVVLGFTAPASSRQAGDGRVIVLGFDGADGPTVERLMAAGELPNLKRLSEQGTFAHLATTNPAESPVAWAALNSGQNPAKTGIPGFMMRELRDGMPIPTKGFAVDPRLSDPSTLTEVESLAGAPIPAWSPIALGLAIGGAALVAFALVFGLLLRLKAVPTAALSIALAAIGVWGGVALRGYLPNRLPVTKNPVKTTPFWESAARAGVKCRVLGAPQAWDRADTANARVLAGLGVPDARGEYTSYFVYTTDEFFFARRIDDPGSDTGSGGAKLRVDERDGVITGEVYGPVNFWQVDRWRGEIESIDRRLASGDVAFREQENLDRRREELLQAIRDAKPLNLPLRVEIQGEKAAVTIGSETQTLAQGQWSDWYRLTFELNPLIKVRAITRAKLVSLKDPCFELYLNAIEIDPSSPPFWQPISQPADFAPALASASGLFETVGWACLTHPFKDQVIDEVTFLEDIEFTTRWRERLTYDGLAKDDWRLFVSVFGEPDRVQHMMYQHFDPAHPLHDAAKAARKITWYGEEISFAEAIPATYHQIDRIVGKVMDEHLRPGDTLILCADHGFQSFRRQVHINNWLAQRGFLALKPGSTGGRVVTQYVDWTKTRAYSMGLGMVYANVKSAQTPKGIVDPQDKAALLREIAAAFLAETDPDTGARIGHSAEIIAEIHRGDHLDLEADLMLGFAPGYRVSWGTTLGGISMSDGEVGPFVVDNDKTWSGDHVSVAPELVRGMFFCNRRIEVPAGGVDLRHVAPTALAAAGVAVPPEYDLPPLRFVGP
jgi:predicted AlkP superfamily phosphohydrolase/phosphomutase